MDDSAASPISPELLPRLVGERVTLRPGTAADAAAMREILSEPTVAQWWGEPDPPEEIAANLRGQGDAALLVVEVDGAIAGGIQYSEATEPNYRHAGIDMYLGGRWQGRGLGAEALRLLVGFLLDRRGHHRLSIDPAAGNQRAIRCYASVGFRPVGVMRQYERGPDGVFHDGLLMDLLASDVARASAEGRRSEDT